MAHLVNRAIFRVVAEETSEVLANNVNLFNAIEAATSFDGCAIISAKIIEQKRGFVAFSNHNNIVVAVEEMTEEFKVCTKNLQGIL